MRNLSRLFLVPTLAAVLLGFASAPSNAARRVGGSAYDGTWSVAIYTLRGDCGSVRVAFVGAQASSNTTATIGASSRGDKFFISSLLFPLAARTFASVASRDFEIS